MPNICCFQLLRCEYLSVFLSLYKANWIYLGFGLLIGQTDMSLGLWKTVKAISPFFPTFAYQMINLLFDKLISRLIKMKIIFSCSPSTLFFASFVTQLCLFFSLPTVVLLLSSPGLKLEILFFLLFYDWGCVIFYFSYRWFTSMINMQRVVSELFFGFSVIWF